MTEKQSFYKIALYKRMEELPELAVQFDKLTESGWKNKEVRISEEINDCIHVKFTNHHASEFFSLIYNKNWEWDIRYFYSHTVLNLVIRLPKEWINKLKIELAKSGIQTEWSWF